MIAPKVPCHRVISARLTLGGFCGENDPNSEMLKKKRRMLVEEGVIFKNGGDRVEESCVVDVSK